MHERRWWELPKRRLLFTLSRSINWKLVAAFLLVIGALVAQDMSTASMSDKVLRVGQRLSCRCGCPHTVASCSMPHCEYSAPLRERIARMQAQGQSDDQIVNTVVREQGVVALSSPPTEGWGLFTWIMPGIAALIGFFIWSAYVKRNRARTPASLSPVDQEVLQRFHEQIGQELEDDPEISRGHLDQRK